MNLPEILVNPENQWRAQTSGGSENWSRTPYPQGGRDKYFIVSADTHMSPPPTMMRDRIDARFKDRVPRMERDENGALWAVVDNRRWGRVVESHLEGEDLYRAKAGGSANFETNSHKLDERLADMALDGIDAELVFPNGPALAAFWTNDIELQQAQFRIYNDWAEEISRPYRDQMNFAACIGTSDVDSAVAEAKRVAKLGFRVVTLPNKPIFGKGDKDHLNYNSSAFDPFWAVLEEADMTVTFHVSTGDDPRSAKGPGGAIINFAVHALSSTAEPLTNVISAGVFDRFPRLRVAVVESGIGWIPWLLDTMDEGYLKHHMWVSPKLQHGLPSEYFHEHCAATFGEDRPGMLMVEELGFQDNFCWANDYPHQEGTFPHSAKAIERQMGKVSEETRAKLLGLNAARWFRFDIPEKYRR